MTTTLRHHSPLGAIAIVGTRGLVEPDTDFELPDHLAARLLEQSDVYELVSGDPRPRETQTVRQLRHELADAGLPYDGRKDDLVERAVEADKVAPSPTIGTAVAPDPIPAPQPVDADGAPVPTPEDEPIDLTDPSVPPSTSEPVDEPVDVVTDEPTTTEPATGQEGA